MAVMAQLFFAASAEASEKITWGNAQQGTYDKLHPYTLNWSGDVLEKGGLNLSTMKLTDKSAEADIVINQYGSMGANGILQVEEELQDPTDSDLSGFSNSVKIEKGAVYLVVLHDGSYAKIRIDRYLPESGLSVNKVFFSYVLEAGRGGQSDAGTDLGGNNGGSGTGTYPGGNNGGAGTGTYPGGMGTGASLSLGNPAEDLKHAEAAYEFSEGEITLPWKALEGHASWDIYRSDNGGPYAKMTDFRLTEPTYTDKYVIAGHTYVYKFVAFNSQGEPVTVER